MHLGINVWYRTFFMQKMIPSILQGFSSECLSVSRLETQAVNGGNHYFLCCKQWRRRDVFTFRDKGSLLIDTKEILQCQERKDCHCIIISKQAFIHLIVGLVCSSAVHYCLCWSCYSGMKKGCNIFSLEII